MRSFSSWEKLAVSCLPGIDLRHIGTMAEAQFKNKTSLEGAGAWQSPANMSARHVGKKSFNPSNRIEFGRDEKFSGDVVYMDKVEAVAILAFIWSSPNLTLLTALRRSASMTSSVSFFTPSGWLWPKSRVSSFASFSVSTSLSRSQSSGFRFRFLRLQIYNL